MQGKLVSAGLPQSLARLWQGSQEEGFGVWGLGFRALGFSMHKGVWKGGGNAKQQGPPSLVARSFGWFFRFMRFIGSIRFRSKRVYWLCRVCWVIHI